MFRFNRSRLQRRLQQARANPLEQLQAHLNAAPQKTPLGDAPLTKSERQWVHRALRQRRALIIWRYIATALTLLLIAFFPIWIIAVDYMIEDRPLIPATPAGAAILFAVLLFCIALAALPIWIQRAAFQTLGQGLFARVPPDFAVLTASGRVDIMAGNEEIVATIAVSQPGQSVPQGLHPVQIPAHWGQHLTDTPYALRLAEVMAGNTRTTLRSLTVLRYENYKIVDQAHQYATYSDARYVLLAAGPFSVDAEAKAGLGLPRLRSGAALQVFVYTTIACAFIAGGAWIWVDRLNGLPPALWTVWIGCAVATVPLILIGLSRGMINRRTARFYVSQG